MAVVDARFMHPEKMKSLDQYYKATPAVSFLKRQEGVFRIAPLDRQFSLNRVGVGNLKLLALLNVKYVVGPEELNHEAFVSVGPGVHENLAALPRVFLVGSVKQVSRENIALIELGIDSFNPAQTAILMDELPGPVLGTEGSTAELVAYEPHETRVRASIRQPCLLVFSEVYYPPGWKASIDGVETTIYRTDYALRSVYLTPGEHTVVMRYVPSHLRRGLFVSLLAAAALVGLLVWPLRGRDRGTSA